MKPGTVLALNALFAAFPSLRAADVPRLAEISLASDVLGVRFPKEYIEFLLHCGGGVVGAYPIFGLRPVNVMEADRWSVVTVTKSFRTAIPEAAEWVVFSEDLAGNPVAFDGEGRIMIFDHDFGGVACIASDFECHLRSTCLKLADESTQYDGQRQDPEGVPSHADIDSTTQERPAEA